ncbi:cysteine-rich CWC family protein [Massilia glaciei]|uniref:cysteine-rich CWC family protein n=1 Tax=Massilia glaciei TaxID=1524097 RepID=UPI000D0E4E27|nr:cysteine-rich CWC family protein [Massilia glaciei]
MSACSACGAQFGCAMADGGDAPCWCTALPPVVAVPGANAGAGCWCPACLRQHIESARRDAAEGPDLT